MVSSARTSARSLTWAGDWPEPRRDLPRLLQEQRDGAAGAGSQDVLLPRHERPGAAQPDRLQDILGQDGGPQHHQPPRHHLLNRQENIGNQTRKLTYCEVSSVTLVLGLFISDLAQ